ncbi:E1 ubiquitin-activating protein aos1 [Paramarasmius palmivorus]|uniref:E1 ubiquitin-activating protein aos1 n=1 Tax=Paramarasmius palmivorus TaxID=297713 RepID=A0AAW0DZI0_9AGAR
MSSAAEFTEEEQGRYDRQIRLWGVEAQHRMRNATILVVRMKGTATETIKNIVLAGIGTLIVVDGDDVTEEDLGAGFFFRDEDVGKKASVQWSRAGYSVAINRFYVNFQRVDVAKARIESLNPLVTVKTIPTYSAVDSQSFETTIRDVDLVCITDWDKDGLIRMNEVCRRSGKPFYAGGTYGLLGSGSKESQKDAKVTTSYTSLENSLRHRWSSLTRRQTKELNPSAVFTILGTSFLGPSKYLANVYMLALWKYESTHGTLPNDATQAAELQSIADALVAEAEVNKQVLVKVPKELIE